MTTSFPPDFPQAGPTGVVPGAQPKLLVREEAGRFVAGPCAQDIRARYILCEDLAQQLVAYSAHKLAENPGRPEARLREKVTQAVRQKAFGWGLSPAETQWVLRRVAALAPVAASKEST